MIADNWLIRVKNQSSNIVINHCQLSLIVVNHCQFLSIVLNRHQSLLGLLGYTWLGQKCLFRGSASIEVGRPKILRILRGGGSGQIWVIFTLFLSFLLVLPQRCYRFLKVTFFSVFIFVRRQTYLLTKTKQEIFAASNFKIFWFWP